MSFSDHTYGEMLPGSENTVIQLVQRFLSEVDQNSTSDEEFTRNSADKKIFISTLEKLIKALQKSLVEMKSDIDHTQSNGHDVYNKSDQSVPDVDPELIQVHADNAEIERRIAAFIERKQQEVNDINNREFCSSFGSQEKEESCARTDAVYIPSEGSVSHVKVSRVVNRFGPQIQVKTEPSQPPTVKTASSVPTTSAGADVEERIRNMEEHLKLDNEPRSDKTRKMELFQRIKRLEERILTLESISPEYVSLVSSPKRKPRKEVFDSDNMKSEEMSLSEIDDRIATLRAKLKRKATGAS